MRKLVLDKVTSKRLGKVRQRDTRPELLLRQALVSRGLRYQTSGRDLPGSPDVVNRSHGWAIWVHGCFWHQHRGCVRATIPKRNRDFWTQKFSANRRRDKRAEKGLARLGYFGLVVWECELESKPVVVAKKLARLLAHLTGAAAQ